MSQFYVGLTAGSLPPTVPTSFVTDDGTAIPAANILNINGGYTSINDNDGIRVIANPDASNNELIQLTNRLAGTASTSGTGTADIITFTPTVIGVYSLECRIAAYNTTSLLGAGYSLFGAIRFDGVNSNICDAFDEIVNEEGAMSGVDIALVVSGADIIVRATGYLGQSINWSAVSLYTFVGA